MKLNIAIIGGGTAGLFLASFLNTDIYDVTIYEKKASVGRKFLVAGAGGFNLTHSEELSEFKSRYTPNSLFEKALNAFTNDDLRVWFQNLGISTFVGSSGRVFPVKGVKPIEVLKTIEAHLIKKNVKFEYNKTFTNWNEENALVFSGNKIVEYDYSIFALGGSSWKVTGSDGSWLDTFAQKGIETSPFIASNCAFNINWPEKFIQRNEGKPLKNISFSINNKTQKGEVVVTKFGLEGNAIYGLSPEIQSKLTTENQAIVFADFKPAFDLLKLTKKLVDSKSNITTILKDEIKLSRSVVELIKATLTKEQYLDTSILAVFIKKFPLTIVGSASIDEAISTSGGIHLNAIEANFELKKMKNNFCIGEMLDWDAPTGGYLIQACASMGVHLARHLNTI